jgi:hypothetical protein
MCALSGRPTLRVYGKGKTESAWREIAVFARGRRNLVSRLPFFRGSCITWTRRVIAVGCDFAEWLVREQAANPASRESPVDVTGGRLHGTARNAPGPSASEVMAHECGHTCQAARWGPLYLPIGALFTWWREGDRWWNWFENEASELGQFGGIVSGSVESGLWERVRS